MVINRFRLECRDGECLEAAKWHDETAAPIGTVVIVHGLGEHFGRFEHLALEFVQRGFCVYSYDQRGHGRNAGKYGHVQDYSLLMEDIGSMLEAARLESGGMPCILYGHSLGGNEVLNYLLDHPDCVSAAIVSSPWIRLYVQPSERLTRIIRIIERLKPDFTFSNGIKLKLTTNNNKIIIKTETDKLFHKRISARLAIQAFEAGERALEHADDISIPVLLMHGTDDKITSFEASRELSLRANDNIHFKSWKDMYHELHNDTDSETVINYMCEWAIGILGNS